MVARVLVKYIVVGQIRNEFIIDSNGRAFQNILGGSLLYTAGSLGFWVNGIGLAGVLSEKFPLEWQDCLRKENLDTTGIQLIPEYVDHRAFFSYSPDGHLLQKKPVAAFAMAGLPLPVELIDFNQEDDTSRLTTIVNYSRIVGNSFPASYLEATTAHICPLDLESHIQLSSLLQKGSLRVISLQPLSSYMKQSNWDKVPAVVKGLTAFITTEEDMRELFRKRSVDLREMAEFIGASGCSCVVIKERQKNYSLYSTYNRKHYRIPNYDVRQLDPTGLLDAFCGGFLAAYSVQYDPLSAAIQGSVAASMKSEGTGPFSIKQSIQELSQARFEWIRSHVIES